MERATAEFLLAALFVEPTPERENALRAAAQAATNFEGLFSALEGHGVLALFRRNVERAGIELPATVAPLLATRAQALADRAQRAWLTLQRWTTSRDAVELTLIRDAAFAFDTYPDRTLRLPVALEALVRPRDFRRAVSAAEHAGLLLSESSLPPSWHRRTHTAVTLHPGSPLLTEVRLRASLHHPSLLLTCPQEELLRQRRRLDVDGGTVFALAPMDRLLDLGVALAARAGETLFATGRRNLVAAAS